MASGARRPVEKFADKQLKILWRKPISSGYSGPTVAGGRVYVTDRVVEPGQVERVHCFDAARPASRCWTHSYDCVYDRVGYTAGPRACVTHRRRPGLFAGHDGPFVLPSTPPPARCCGARIATPEYKIRMPIWGIAASPLVEDDLVIVQIGGEGACLVAFDKRTGDEKWRALDDNASYSAPIIIEQAGHRVLVCWTGDNVVGLDPAHGRSVIGSTPSSRPRWSSTSPRPCWRRTGCS